MGKQFDVRANYSEVGRLLKSEDLEKKLEELARKKAGGWNTDTKKMGSRVIASIYTSDYDEVAEELDTHRITGGLT